MKIFNTKGSEFRRHFKCLLILAALAWTHPVYAACDTDIDCQNKKISDLKQQI